jgi:hypothetical protein
MKQFGPYRRSFGLALALSGLMIPFGCYNTPVDVNPGPAPLRMPPPEHGDDCSYEDSLQGHQIFDMYCASCHTARTLSERPFSNYQNATQHMRVRANLTGKEYAKLMAWMRRWHDVPNPDLHETPSPKRFFFSQPIPELKDKQAKAASNPVAGPRAGATDEAGPGQPPPGTGPMQPR